MSFTRSKRTAYAAGMGALLAGTAMKRFSGYGSRLRSRSAGQAYASRRRKGSYGYYVKRESAPPPRTAALCVNYAPGPFAMVYRTRQTVCQVIDETSATGFKDDVWYGNSVHDCDVSAGSLDANGYTKLANLYNDFKVYYSRCEVDVVNRDTNDPVYVTIIPNGFSNAYSIANRDAVMSQPYARTEIVVPESGVSSVTNEMTTKKIKGVRNLDDEAFKGIGAAVPTNLWYWHIVIANNTGDQALDVEYRVRITYLVDWSEISATIQ